MRSRPPRPERFVDDVEGEEAQAALFGLGGGEAGEHLFGFFGLGFGLEFEEFGEAFEVGLEVGSRGCINLGAWFWASGLCGWAWSLGIVVRLSTEGA